MSLRDVIWSLDAAASRVAAPLERPGLSALLFHSLFETRDEIARDSVYPQEAVTRPQLARLVECYLRAGYRFVDGNDIAAGLAAGERCVWLTFDDGYANNLRLPGVLETYGIPATVFVATGYVTSGRRFWWDALYAERRRRRVSLDRIERELESLKTWRPERIVAHVERELGARAFEPTSDLDRPLNEDELRDLAACELVEIGNHTVDHAILTVLDDDEVEAQLAGAQRDLERILGVAPRVVAYPNGGFDDRVAALARSIGLTVGVTTLPRKTPVPVGARELMTLGRFQLERGRDEVAQARVLRGDLQLSNRARRLRRAVRSRR